MMSGMMLTRYVCTRERCHDFVLRFFIGKPAASSRAQLTEPHNADVRLFDIDNAGRPNGNTPSYRIRINSISGPTTGPIMVRGFFNSNQNLHHDNLGLWAFQQASASIKKGTTGNIDYIVIAGVMLIPCEQFEARPRATGNQRL
jgi:hypothetical protein